MIAMEDMVDVWEMERVENVELYATGTLILNVLFLKRTVVARVSEGIVYSAYFYALAGFFCKEVEEKFMITTVNYYSTPKNLSTASPAKEKPFFVPRFSPGVTPQP